MSGVARSITGTIAYTSNQAHRLGAERGRESFRLDIHRDGSRVLAAHCEIDDAPAVVRDVNLRVDVDNLPRECFVRIAVGGQFRGSGWFAFTPGEATCEASTSIEGRVSQRYALDTPLRAFGNHAIINDGYAMSLYDLSQGPGKQTFFMLLSSPDHRGATGPMLFPVQLAIEYVGEQDITVQAGTFRARHFRILDVGMPEEHPDYDLWVTADEHYILLRATVTGYMQTAYELSSYQVVEHAPC
ncbi:hypothetical protein ABB25_11905 [Stenotrophomonas koreensis]|uniref:DUF3108 domain-containing protein n=1 Tax=Stenotrophomonas koreensis TaxID=266128 RepID=A0A0R0BDQ2_9GAMM|nr:hypothetical protein [Stenotrophomonas koreensis]KRG55398.1 hypothetical protein ABB25_11905 [Stenotrophomonas koreensis]